MIVDIVHENKNLCERRITNMLVGKLTVNEEFIKKGIIKALAEEGVICSLKDIVLNVSRGYDGPGESYPDTFSAEINVPLGNK
jgi:hypothetical protein